MITELENLILKELKRWNNLLRKPIAVYELIQYCLSNNIGRNIADQTIRDLFDKELICCNGIYKYQYDIPVTITQKGYDELNGKNVNELSPKMNKAASFIGKTTGEFIKTLNE